MEMFREGNGQLSLLRILVAFVVVVFSLTYCILSIQQKGFVDLSGTQLAAFGLPLVLKVAQKFAEGKPIDIDTQKIAKEVYSIFEKKDKE